MTQQRSTRHGLLILYQVLKTGKGSSGKGIPFGEAAGKTARRRSGREKEMDFRNQKAAVPDKDTAAEGRRRQERAGEGRKKKGRQEEQQEKTVLLFPKRQ